ncbi:MULTISPECIES: arylesterase [unclassified Wenzhouxiangella]|uniref:arylesterase n=1 Tax=unclassified Wenzhouxiangella TaxID=2613841 RepID=UPI000E327F37|nr:MULTISPECIES: arylesterase [unclassified Wenzhouxiangella]RFF27621.1 arylesterase [Wenzhouxiangella sp. 15181]RFP70145.1 arylesterase [Wenzhouxiangella sp. 15190]
MFKLFPKGLFIALLSASLCLPVSAATVMVVGDSLSDAYSIPRESGWVHLLSERLDGEHEVINASISGETTAGAVTRIDGLLETHRPDVVLIILGGNDGLRGLSPTQTEDNLAAVIEKGKSADATVALMQIRLPPNLGPVYIERFEAIYPRLAERYDIEFLPFFIDDIFDKPGMLQDDGIHPTAEAQPLMLEAVWPKLQALLAG